MAHRTAWTLAHLGLLIAALALPAAAVAAVPVALYPVQVDGLTDGERSEVQSVVESALAAADRRGVLETRTPLVLPATCKPPITVGCVATQAKGGVVLYAKAKRRGAQILVTILFVDGVGRRTRAAAFPLDLFIQNLRPAAEAIATLEGELAAGALEDPTPPPAPRAPAAERPKAAVADQRPEPSPQPAPAPPQAPAVAEPLPAAEPAPAPSARPSAPIDLTPVPRAEPPRPPHVAARPPEKEVAAGRSGGDWRRTAGSWFTGSGLAMLAAGAVVGLTGKRLADELDNRYANRALRPGDGALYDRVDRYALIANALFVAGGVTTAAGLTLHAIAPAGGGAGVAVAGSF
jgi:hypothetical protein